MEQPRIQTSRLVIDPVQMDDAPAMFSYRSRPEMYFWHTFEPRQLSEMESFIAKVLTVAWDTPDSWFQLAIRSRSTGTLIGDFGVHFVDEGPGQVEIGYSMSPEWQGQGVATEAVSAVLKHVFETMEKHRVFASVDPRNEPSLRLMRRLRFREEAHHRESMWFKNAWVDDVVFGMLRTEWLERAPNPQS